MIENRHPDSLSAGDGQVAKPSQEVGLRPYSWYKRFLVEGARSHGLPADYITMLEALEGAMIWTVLGTGGSEA